MRPPKFTIGMASCDDYEGVWATVQSIFLHNDWDHPDDVQIIIADNSPVGSDHRALVKDFVSKGGNEAPGSRTGNIKYIDMAGFAGTTKPRDMIFDHADGEFVCVMDCHVMLRSNALRQLLDWFAAHRNCQDLIHGPILYDNLHMIGTHFDDQFRGGMWGTWGNAWRSPAGDIFVCQGEEVTDENRKRESTKMTAYDLMTLKPFASDEHGVQVLPSGLPVPSLDWAGHDRELIALDFTEMGRPDTDYLFEIPGQGMGLFASRKDSWLGFAKNCSGFGGEEMNIHTKYRQAGRKAVCLPFLKWNHRFGRAGGAPYPIPLAAKLRNYVLWAKELDIPLDRIHLHFVASGQFSQTEWDKLVADPVNYPVNLEPPKRVASGQQPLDFLYLQAAVSARDLKEHAETIKSVAAKVDSVTAFVKRTDWEPLIAAGFPKKIEVYQSEEGPLIDQTHEAVKQQHVKDHRQIQTYSTHREKNNEKVDPLEVESIEQTDLLVIDKINSAEYLSAVLAKHGSKADRFIMIRGTQAFGEHAEHDQSVPGLWLAMRDWITAHPDWFIAQHWPRQYGLTLLAKEPHPRPSREVRPWPKGYGPGTELAKMLADVGIEPPANCGCKATMREMDELGVDGCREHRQAFIDRIKENAEKWGWGKLSTMHTLAGVGVKSMLSGLAWKVNWLDPFPGLVDEAIKRAEINCTKNCDPATCKKPGCKRKESVS